MTVFLNLNKKIMKKEWQMPLLIKYSRESVDILCGKLGIVSEAAVSSKCPS